MKDLNIIKDIVNDYFQINITKKTRMQVYVDARGIYYSLSRELVPGATYEKLGKSVNLNHATVVNGMKQFNFLLEYNKSTQNNYLTLKSICLKNIDKLSLIHI